MSELVSLAHLLRLLDDEAPVVREAVSRELSKYGARRGEAVVDWPEPVSRSERQLRISRTRTPCSRKRSASRGSRHGQRRRRSTPRPNVCSPLAVTLAAHFSLALTISAVGFQPSR